MSQQMAKPISAYMQQASSIEDIPGQAQSLQGKVLEAAEGAIQQFSPFSRIHQHVCGFHFYAHDITRQVIPPFPLPVLLNALLALLLPLRLPLDTSLEIFSSAGSNSPAFGILFFRVGFWDATLSMHESTIDKPKII